jgi:hypothetical protein
MGQRVSLFESDPVPELRGLASLTDPDDDVAAVIDLAVLGGRGDGKTQFLVHAIRALQARAAAVTGAEADLNRAVMRLVLDPRAPRPEATPPGVVPHFTFRVAAATLFEQLGWRGALLLARRLARVGGLIVLASLLAATGVGAGILHHGSACVIGLAGGAFVAAVAALAARRRIAHAGDIEIAFWDIAGEHVYSEAAADYHAILGQLVDARQRRAVCLGRPYAFAPVLICNPLVLGTLDDASPYARLRAVLPLFAALSRGDARALIAINRWQVVDPICERGAVRDEVITVHAGGAGGARPVYRVARERVRVHCLDAEDGHDGHIAIRHVRYDTALHSRIERGEGDAALTYAYDEGPGALGGDARRRFLTWIAQLPTWNGPRVEPPARESAREPARERATEHTPPEVWARPR